MTEPERPADAPSSPTPEEISARLEALLKRTHALRAKQAANPPSPLTITWPPHDGELDHYDVVDVPEDDRMQPAARATAATPPPSATAVPPPGAPRGEPERPASFARPDWSELRLRSSQDDSPRPSRGLLLLTLLLALATIAQAVYIFSMPRGASPGEGRLRIDGPDGAIVRVNGQLIGPAPVDHVLAPGDYDVEIAPQGSAALASRVSIGVGRTIVLLPPADTKAAGAPPVAAMPPAVDRGPVPAARPPATAPAPANTAAATAPAAVSATLGGVSIESTPSGLPVTMEGRERGVTPITIGRLKPGRHDVLVGGLARKVDVTAGSVTTLRVISP